MAEKKVHQAVINYIKLQYPKVMFNTDMSGIRLTTGQAKQAKKLRNPETGWPDIFIAQPNGRFNGLFIEVKDDDAKVYKKRTGSPYNDHIAKQLEVIFELNNRGYDAYMCIGFDEAKGVIDHYLNLDND